MRNWLELFKSLVSSNGADDYVSPIVEQPRFIVLDPSIDERAIYLLAAHACQNYLDKRDAGTDDEIVNFIVDRAVVLHRALEAVRVRLANEKKGTEKK